MVKKSNYCVIDTETTGLDSEPLAEVIEVAFQILNYKDLSVMAEFESLIKPKNIDLNGPIPKWALGAFRVNNISIEELKLAPSAEEVCEKIIGIFMAAKKPIIVAQNSAFDMEMLNRLFDAREYKFNKYIWRPVIDLYAISHLLWVYDASMPNLKLGTIAEKMDVKAENSHRAMDDVIVTANVFKKFMLFFKDKGNEISDIKVIKGGNKSMVKNSKYMCPKCGGGLQCRVAKQGRFQGNTFWGCQSYPSCRFLCQPEQVAQYEGK
jgi:DNA polymerase III alpha subunit (gram-positive type)